MTPTDRVLASWRRHARLRRPPVSEEIKVQFGNVLTASWDDYNPTFSDANAAADWARSLPHYQTIQRRIIRRRTDEIMSQDEIWSAQC